MSVYNWIAWMMIAAAVFLLAGTGGLRLILLVMIISLIAAYMLSRLLPAQISLTSMQKRGSLDKR